jgi:hypothetical protein
VAVCTGFTGVYAVGHPGLSAQGRWMAAVLACGEGAVLSHRSAAELWKMLDPASGLIQVSVPTTAGRRRRAGIRLHRRRSLDARSMSHKGIPVTTPAQTIADLTGNVAPAQLRRAIRQAEVLGLRTGVAAGEPTRSELEHRFLRLCHRHRIPMPEVNVRVGKFEVDFLWRQRRLIVETDGYRFHRGSAAVPRPFQLTEAWCERGPVPPPNVLRFSPTTNLGRRGTIQRASE